MHSHEDTETGTIANVRVGEPDTRPDAPSHTAGIRQGNRPPRLERKRGLKEVDMTFGRATPTRSTGINAEDRRPIDPRMPLLTPP